MSNEAIITNNSGLYTTVVIADHATSFSPTAAHIQYDGANTDLNANFDADTLASDAAWQSDKADFGATRAPLYRVDACFDHAAATAGDAIDLYWSASHSATVGTGNATDVTGVDGTFTSTADLLAQMQYIGSLSLNASDTISKGHVGFLVPSKRYGSLVVVSATATAALTTNPANTHIAFIPVSYGT
jgi:hypothetical protein